MSYIKRIICEAYREQETRKVIFVKYYILENQAWLDYRNRDEKTTSTNGYFSEETSTLTLILNEDEIQEGLSYKCIRLVFGFPYDMYSKTYHLISKVGTTLGFPNKELNVMTYFIEYYQYTNYE